MKTEYREVLVKQPVYIAEDGKEFETDRECYKYEQEQREKSMLCYDDCFERTTPAICRYVDLPDKESVLAFCRYLEEHWMYTDGLSAPGVYIYVNEDEGDCECSWVNVTEVIAKIRGGSTDGHD